MAPPGGKGAAPKAAPGSLKPAAATGTTGATTAQSGPTASKPAAPGTKGAASAARGTPATSKASASATPQKGTDAKAKGKAVKGSKVQNVSDTAGQPTSSDPPEPETSEEEQRAKVQAALEKALADTEQVRAAAWQAQVEADRRKQAEARRKAEEQAKRKREEARICKAALEAAFDDEEPVLLKLLTDAAALGMSNPVEMSDGHGNTLLSEAAAGGALATLQTLLGRGANPNSQGEFGRTPLWRAAFLGHDASVSALLEAGADPRITNEQGEHPADVASKADIKAILTSWDVSRTEALVEKWAAAQEAARANLLAQAAAAVTGAAQRVEKAETEHARAQQALKHSRQELEKRIFEHDLCVEEHKPEELVQATLSAIKDAEAAVAAAQSAAAAALAALDSARLQLREQEEAERLAKGVAGSGGDGDGEEPLPGQAIAIKELDDVLIRDVGGRLAAIGMWPLVIDTTGQANVFLRYLDTNYVNVLSPQHTQPTRLRRSLLGALRYGKPLVLDLMDVADLWAEVPAMFDRVQTGLLASLLDKSLLKDDAYLKLALPEDGEEYDHTKFQATRVAAFKLIIHTAAPRPPPALLQATHVFRVNAGGR